MNCFAGLESKTQRHILLHIQFFVVAFFVSSVLSLLLLQFFVLSPHFDFSQLFHLEAWIPKCVNEGRNRSDTVPPAHDLMQHLRVPRNSLHNILNKWKNGSESVIF